jgi:hypothetical protein
MHDVTRIAVRACDSILREHVPGHDVEDDTLESVEHGVSLSLSLCVCVCVCVCVYVITNVKNFLVCPAFQGTNM